MIYEILDHTADIKLRTFGQNFKEILENSSYAISDLLVSEKINYDRNYNFEIEGESREQILVRLLNEIIYLLQTKKFIFKKFEVTQSALNRYEISCSGTEIKEPETVNYDIKGVTYHDLKISGDKTKLTAEFVIDV